MSAEALTVHKAPVINRRDAAGFIFNGTRVAVGTFALLAFGDGIATQVTRDGLVNDDKVINDLNAQKAIVNTGIAARVKLLSVTRQPELKDSLTKEVGLLALDQQSIQADLDAEFAQLKPALDEYDNKVITRLEIAGAGLAAVVLTSKRFWRNIYDVLSD